MQYFHILKQVQELHAKSYKTLTEKKNHIRSKYHTGDLKTLQIVLQIAN